MQKLELKISRYENGYIISRQELSVNCQKSAEYYVAETTTRAAELVQQILDWQEIKPKQRGAK